MRLSLISEKATSYDYGKGIWRRKKGEVLRRGIYSSSQIERLRSSSNIPNFETLYQQRPEGSFERVREKDFVLHGVRSLSNAGIVLSIDTAHGQGENGSFSVIQAWQRVDDCHQLIEQWREHATFASMCRALKHFYRRYRPSIVLIENTGVGSALIEYAQRRATGKPTKVIGVNPGTISKLIRLKSVLPTIKRGRIYLPAGAAFTPEFIKEVTSFPGSDTDDQLDAMTQYLGWASTNDILQSMPREYGVMTNKRAAAAQVALQASISPQHAGMVGRDISLALGGFGFSRVTRLGR